MCGFRRKRLPETTEHHSSLWTASFIQSLEIKLGISDSSHPVHKGTPASAEPGMSSPNHSRAVCPGYQGSLGVNQCGAPRLLSLSYHKVAGDPCVLWALGDSQRREVRSSSRYALIQGIPSFPLAP